MPTGNVEMVFWDVQHGHSTYVKSPNGKHIVVDLGIGDYSGRNTSFSPLLHLKNNYNVHQLDYVIITHPHLDHIDDILNFDSLSPKVFNRPNHIPNSEILKNVRQQDKAKFDKYCELNNRYTTDITNTILDPHIPSNLGGLSIKTFNPNSCDVENFNNHSSISVLEYCNTKVVIPGDNEKCSFEELMKLDTFKDAVKNADILLAPHHGRESGFFLDFVNLVNPHLTIVSDGKYCDTSANGRYSQKSSGWKVFKKNGNSEVRKCLTTNSDGEIFVSFGPSSDTQYSCFLNVQIS